MRGEKAPQLSEGLRGAGSPPRARGKDHVGDGQSPLHGITPACAGKSPAPPKKGPGLWDHPRVRGEKRLHSWRAMSMSGSPPRARGKDWEEVWGEDGFGITPACAGKRSGKSGSAKFCGDHPRVRGEKRRPGLCPAVAQGSPPRARGKAHVRYGLKASPGITPACAGKRYLLPHQSAGEQDHPRVRGEKSLSRKEHMADLGSPPRARGKGCTDLNLEFDSRITPACAGKR